MKRAKLATKKNRWTVAADALPRLTPEQLRRMRAAYDGGQCSVREADYATGEEYQQVADAEGLNSILQEFSGELELTLDQAALLASVHGV